MKNVKFAANGITIHLIDFGYLVVTLRIILLETLNFSSFMLIAIYHRREQGY